MLGEKIGQEKGKVTTRRVLTTDGPPKLEISFESTGQLLGVDEQTVGTYWSQMRPDGSLYGEGEGVVMGKNGEAATWKGQGVGTIAKDGVVNYRGALYFQTQSEKWLRLNTIAAVFEYDVDAEGNTTSQTWEWR